MSIVRKYSDLMLTLGERPELKLGVVADSNVLISATYESDRAHDRTIEFFDLLSENQIPVFCNVNARAEFLEIHRRIIFTEALIDFARTADRTKLSNDVIKRLHSLITRSAAAEAQDQGSPLRLSEPEIKWFKMRLMIIAAGGINLWEQICLEKVGNKIGHAWDRAVNELGLNFLSLRKEDANPYITQSPEWSGVVSLIEKHGLSSSDAMIVNLFIASNLVALVTSDIEVAHTVASISRINKICFIIDKLA